MKTCDRCTASNDGGARVNIGDGYEKKPIFYKLACALLIYLPLISLPFVFLSAWCAYARLKMVGANNLRPLKSFLPDRKTHRYTLKTQVTMEPGFPFSPIQSKLFWIANCTWYCPLSVGLFEWHAYLVKLRGNGQYPFCNDRNDSTYRESKQA